MLLAAVVSGNWILHQLDLCRPDVAKMDAHLSSCVTYSIGVSAGHLFWQAVQYYHVLSFRFPAYIIGPDQCWLL